MSTQTINATDGSNGASQRVREPEQTAVEWPQFQTPVNANVVFPPLHTPGARTVVRDRWERLVTTIELPDAPERVWSALTTPASLKLWFAACQGSLDQSEQDCVLDFEDGEFFLCHTLEARRAERLQYLWRWVGLGQATTVTWNLEPVGAGTRVTVTEEALNPPWDWQTWNGGGWPGILDQLAAYLRTGMSWRWPWRRMGPYAQVELPVPFYEAWDRLMSPSGTRFWLQVMSGQLEPEQSLTILMGDASGAIEMAIREVVLPGQAPPSFLPHLDFSLKRQVWGCEVGGRLWMEPAGWGRSLVQVVHYNWENLPAGLQLSERKLLANFWAGAMRRAMLLCGAVPAPAGPHSWS
jgi:uncharacterized protein YndB with AHSA1/START domain